MNEGYEIWRERERGREWEKWRRKINAEQILALNELFQLNIFQFLPFWLDMVKKKHVGNGWRFDNDTHFSSSSQWIIHNISLLWFSLFKISYFFLLSLLQIQTFQTKILRFQISWFLFVFYDSNLTRLFILCRIFF